MQAKQHIIWAKTARKLPLFGGRPKLICVPVWRQKSRVAFFVSHP